MSLHSIVSMFDSADSILGLTVELLVAALSKLGIRKALFKKFKRKRVGKRHNKVVHRLLRFDPKSCKISAKQQKILKRILNKKYPHIFVFFFFFHFYWTFCFIILNRLYFLYSFLCFYSILSCCLIVSQ